MAFSDAPRIQSFQYQASANPPTQSQGMEWYQPWREPSARPSIAKAAAVALIASGAVLVEAAPFAEATTVDRWQRPFSEPVRTRNFGVQYQQSPQFIYVSFTGSGVGAVPTGFNSQPRIQSFQYQTVAKPAFVPPSESVTVDKWYIPLSTKPDGGFASIDTSADFIAIETVSEDRWHQPWSEPVRTKPGLWAGNQQTLAYVRFPVADTITLDKWFRPPSEPVRSRSFGVQYQQSPQFIFVSVTGSGVGAVPTGFSDQPRIQSFQYQVSAAPVFTPTTETITVDKWWQPLAEPVRVKAGLAAPLQQSLALVKAAPFPETVSIDRWLLPLSEPVRIKPGLLADTQREVGYANIQPLVSFGWFNWLNEPVRLKPGLGAPYQLVYAANTSPFTETVTVDKWFTWLAEPVRVKARLGTALNQYEAFVKASPFPETVTESRWHQPWSEPVRFRRLPTSEQQVLAYVRVEPPAPVFTNWFTGLSEPVRFRHLARAQYPFFAYYPPPLPSPTIIVRPSDQAEVSIYEIEANKGAYVSIVEIIYR
jgi:hypothetical protein